MMIKNLRERILKAMMAMMAVGILPGYTLDCDMDDGELNIDVNHSHDCGDGDCDGYYVDDCGFWGFGCW